MNYHKIDICNMNNGSGLRCVVWVSGCNHNCNGCFNPETWDINGGDLLQVPQIEMIIEALTQDWCSGITLTGGDPLHPCNRADIEQLCYDIKTKFPNKTIWIYTGYTWEELIQLNSPSINNILFFTDVLVDGPFKQEWKSPSEHWTGSINQRVIDVPRSLQYNCAIKWNYNNTK